MIKIKFEVNDEEEEVTLLPIENENEQVKALLSLNFFGNNNNNSCLSSTNLNNVTSIDNNVLKKSPAAAQKKKKLKQLDNSTTDSVVLGLKSIKTEPKDSSMSLTTQLNNSLNIQSLLTQNRIQNGWTTNEQSIPIGTQQQLQSFLVPKIEPIVPGNHQEVPLSLDQNASIPNGTQQQQRSLLVPKIEPIVADIHQEIPLSLDQIASISNSNSMETTTTTTNCDITTTELFLGLRASLSRRAKLNVCYSVPMELEPLSRKRKKLPESSPSADNSESATSNDNDQHSGSGSISGLDPSTAFSTAEVAVAAPSPPEAAVPLLVGKKPLLRRVSRRVPSLTLEEKKKAHRIEADRLWYQRKKAPPVLDPEVEAEKLRQESEYHQNRWQRLLANATPEQRELMRVKNLERVRLHLDKESEEQRQRRLERGREYHRMVGKLRKEQQWKTMTPEEREKKRANQREYSCRFRKKKKKGLEEQTESQTSNSISSMSSSSMNLVMDNSESSTSTLTNDNTGIVEFGTLKRKKRKSFNKRFELSMDDFDSSHFDIDGGGEEESNGQTILKPGPSKLPRATRFHRNVESKSYLEPDTDSDDSD